MILGLITNFFTWFTTKDKVEITFKLDGWITIGSVKYPDLPSLKLMLDQEEVKNILKVSWRIMNTGNKGIMRFESGPLIEFPKGLYIIAAKISEYSPLLKVPSSLRIVENQVFIDSLGMFNSKDFFKVDFYLKDVAEQNITSQYFKVWNLKGKSLDLSISHDISFAQQFSKAPFPKGFDLMLGMIILAVLASIYISWQQKKYKMDIDMINFFKIFRSSLNRNMKEIDKILEKQKRYFKSN